MGAALLAHHLQAIDADVVVTSAGTRAVNLPVDPHAVAALESMGVDITAHRPRQLSRDIVKTEGADLVLTMTRLHLREVATTLPMAFRRTFTFRELSRNLPAHAVRPEDGDESIERFLFTVGGGRRPADLLGNSATDDVADPYGMGRDAVRRTAHEIDALCRALAAGVPWPLSVNHGC